MNFDAKRMKRIKKKSNETPDVSCTIFNENNEELKYITLELKGEI